MVTESPAGREPAGGKVSPQSTSHIHSRTFEAGAVLLVVAALAIAAARQAHVILERVFG